MKRYLLKSYMILSFCIFSTAGILAQENPSFTNSIMEEKLSLTEEWDKVFPQSDKVNHSKITFHNRYGITLAADLYIPKNAEGKLPAIAVCGPFGAVKEQVSGLYAQRMAELGFLTIAFDPSFTGESGGQPRYVASPDINTEDFCAAIDYLSTRSDVDPDRIGIIGICGWGGMAVNAAAIDTRIKATVAVTMYDMSRVTANGYFDEADNADARNAMREELNAQRTEDYKNGTYKLAGGVIDPVPEDAPQFVKDYNAYYKTPRGYHKRSLGSKADGTRHRAYHSSTCPSYRMPMRFTMPYFSYMERKRTHAISAKAPSKSSKAITKNWSSFPMPAIPTCMTIWEKFPSIRLHPSCGNISNNQYKERYTIQPFLLEPR